MARRTKRRPARRRKPAARRRTTRRRTVKVTVRNPRRRRRPVARRRKRRRANPKFGRHRPTMYYGRKKGGRTGWKTKRSKLLGRKRVRVNPRRRRRKTYRNPKFLPSMRQVQGYVKDGLMVGAGWVGVNGVLMLADRLGLATLKAGRSPTTVAAINFVARILAIGPTCYLGKMLLGQKNVGKIAIGGAFNAVYHGAQDVLAAAPAGSVPSPVAEALLGYDGDPFLAGMGDYIALPQGGMSDYVGSGGFAPVGMAHGTLARQASFT